MHAFPLSHVSGQCISALECSLFIIINRHRQCGRYPALEWCMMFYFVRRQSAFKAAADWLLAWIIKKKKNHLSLARVTYAQRRQWVHVIHIERYVPLMLIGWPGVRSRVQITSRKIHSQRHWGIIVFIFVYASQPVQWHCWRFVNFYRNS